MNPLMFVVMILGLIAGPASTWQWMYGFPCKENSDCHTSSMVCSNRRCSCNKDIFYMADLYFNKFEARWECRNLAFNAEKVINSYRKECDGPGDNSCINNRQCVKYKCVCNEGYLMIDNKCREFEHVRLGESCSTPQNGPVKYCDLKYNMSCRDNTCQCIREHYADSDNTTCIFREGYVDKFRANLTVKMFESCGDQSNGLPNLCNEAANMTCIYSKCQCKSSFYYNETVSTCKTKKSFATEYNLTRYQVMPGMYCHTSSDCIYGTLCSNFKCRCPYPCEYEARSFACNCGKVSAVEGAARPIVVGIIGGMVIIAGWLYLIRKQIRKAKDPEYVSTGGDNNCNVSLQPTSNRSHIDSTEPYRIQAATGQPRTQTAARSTEPYRIQTATGQPRTQTAARSTEPYRIQTAIGQPNRQTAASGQPGSSSSPSSAAARPEKKPLPESDTSFSPYNPYLSYPSSNSDLPPSYDSLSFPVTTNLEPSAPSTIPDAVKVPYPAAPSLPTDPGYPSYPTAPPTAPSAASLPYPLAPSLPTAPPTVPTTAPFLYGPPAAAAPLPYPAAPSYPSGESAEAASGIPREAPPSYISTPPQTDIYKPN